MARAIIVAFDDFIAGTNAVYTSEHLEEALAELEAMALEVIVDPSASSYTDNTTVQIETSADGRNWKNKNPHPEIDTQPSPTGQTTVIEAIDMGVRPPLGRVRLRIQLAGGVPAAHVQVLVREAEQPRITPGRAPGCVVWLRADMGLTLGAGNVVSGWADQSGHGNHAVQATGSRQPVLQAASNSFNGLPALGFDGVNDYLATQAFSLGIYTVFMVCTGQDATNGLFWIRSTSTTGVDTLYGDVYCTMYASRGGPVSCRDHTSGWGNWGSSTAKVLVVQFDGTQAGHTLRVNKDPISLYNHIVGDPGTSTNSYKFCIAARDDDAALPAKIAVAEVAVFDRVLGISDVSALEEYARRRYLLY